MIKCPNCTKEIFETAVRCKHCKTKLLDGNVIEEKQGVVKDEVKQGVVKDEVKQGVVNETYTPTTSLNFNQAVSTCFRKYYDFNGRASRSEFWYFVIFTVLVAITAKILDTYVLDYYLAEPSPFTTLNQIFLLCPSIAVTVRRLHDSNKSGFRMLWAMTIIGFIPVLYWYSKKGDADQNDYTDDGIEPLPPLTFKALFNGDFGLFLSYWGFGYLGWSILDFISEFLLTSESFVYIAYVYALIVVIPVWKSASRYKGDSNGLLWIGLAKASVIISLIGIGLLISVNSYSGWFDKTICVETDSLETGGIIYLPNETTPFTGKNFCKHANGEKKSKGKVEDGKRYELWNEWYENGEIKFETSFNDGQIEKRKNYENENIVGQTLFFYHTNNQLKVQVEWKLDSVDSKFKKHGKETRWYENGQKKSEAIFKDNELVGSVITFTDNS